MKPPTESGTKIIAKALWKGGESEGVYLSHKDWSGKVCGFFAPKKGNMIAWSRIKAWRNVPALTTGEK